VLALPTYSVPSGPTDRFSGCDLSSWITISAALAAAEDEARRARARQAARIIGLSS